MADDWTPNAAADELSVRVDLDFAALRLLRARVAKVMLQRSTRLGARATLTVEAHPDIDEAEFDERRRWNEDLDSTPATGGPPTQVVPEHSTDHRSVAPD